MFQRGGTCNKVLSLFPFIVVKEGVKLANLYTYKGPVMEFDRCISNNWESSTYATSEKKARSNLTYQYKKKHGKIPATKITLPGKISLVS